MTARDGLAVVRAARFRWRLCMAAFAVASGCGGRGTPPSGPAPEYERPVLTPWDAGALPSDPLSGAVDEVDDEPSTDAGAALDGTVSPPAPVQ